MAQVFKDPYNHRTKETIDKIMKILDNTWVTNKIYEYEGRFYFYINQRNYLHILKPNRVKIDNKSFYEMEDWLLKPDNTLKLYVR